MYDVLYHCDIMNHILSCRWYSSIKPSRANLSKSVFLDVCVCVRSIYSSTDTAIGMLARNYQPTELEGRKALTGARLALSQSLNPARSAERRCRSVLSVDFGSEVCQFWSVNCRSFDAGRTCDNVGIYVTSCVVKETFIYLFIIAPVLNSRRLKY